MSSPFHKELPAEDEVLRAALLRAFHELVTDYTSEVWGRDLQYIADALGLEMEVLDKAAYGKNLEEFMAIIAGNAS